MAALDVASIQLQPGPAVRMQAIPTVAERQLRQDTYPPAAAAGPRPRQCQLESLPPLAATNRMVECSRLPWEREGSIGFPTKFRAASVHRVRFPTMRQDQGGCLAGPGCDQVPGLSARTQAQVVFRQDGLTVRRCRMGPFYRAVALVRVAFLGWARGCMHGATR